MTCCNPTRITAAVPAAQGTTVIWENRDEIPHAVYFPTLNVYSNVLDTDDTFHCRFDQGGTFDYICSIHPHMRGRIVVSG
jgi:plastocyanin